MDPPARMGRGFGAGKLGRGAPALPGGGLTCNTTGGDFGVTPGMLKIPAICGVTRTTIDEEGSVVPLINSIWWVWATISNCKPDTTGLVMGAAPSPKLVIVNRADSPSVICAGWIVAYTSGSSAIAGAADTSNTPASTISHPP